MTNKEIAIIEFKKLEKKNPIRYRVLRNAGFPDKFTIGENAKLFLETLKK